MITIWLLIAFIAVVCVFLAGMITYGWALHMESKEQAPTYIVMGTWGAMFSIAGAFLIAFIAACLLIP